jgi:hypothetical protein
MSEEISVCTDPNCPSSYVPHKHTATAVPIFWADAEPDVIDTAHLKRLYAWSQKTFGPQRLHGVLKHIRKEVNEAEEKPDDVMEWADVLILVFDGAMRAGHEPQQIIDAIKAKQAINEAREWPDWRTADPNEPIEHIKEERALLPRVFVLMRDEDISGVSGTGLVAWGVEFPDGRVATRWNSDVAQTCAWDSMEHVEKIHGHGGATRIVWLS